jgi:hypothetical protein
MGHSSNRCRVLTFRTESPAHFSTGTDTSAAHRAKRVVDGGGCQHVDDGEREEHNERWNAGGMGHLNPSRPSSPLSVSLIASCRGKAALADMSLP